MANDDFSDILLDVVSSAGKGASTATSAASGAKAETGVPGTILRVKIHTENWFNDGEYSVLDCGAFEIDACDLSGPPNVVTIRALSTPLSSSLTRQENCRAWEQVTLWEIARDIADAAGMTLLYEVGEFIYLDRIDQLQQSDLVFLQGLCHNYGVSVKITDNQIVLFSEADYEQRAIVDTFKAEQARTESHNSGRILSYRFSQDTTDTVSSSTVSYKDPKSGKLVMATFTPVNPPATGQEYRSNQRPGNLGDNAYLSPGSAADDFANVRVDATATAMRQAMAEAREKNKNEWNCDLALVGDTKIVAGVTFLIEGFGVYDGKYIVDEATHSLGGGYITSVKAHRVLEGY